MGKRLIGLLTDLFPVWVIIAGGMAIFHPPLFTWFHGPLITWGLAIIMLGMGVTLTEEDFVRVLKRPGPVFLGFVGQYTIMPLLGYTLAHVLNLNQATSVGLILVACCPGGTASNVVTFLARGDVALSVTMTACSTLAAVIMTPILTWLLAGAYVRVDVLKLLIEIAQVVLIPVVTGVMVNRYAPKFSCRIQTVAPLVSVVFIVLIVASVLGSRADDIKHGALKQVASVLLLHSGGFALGYILARIFRLNPITSRTISIEVGMQNSGLGTVLAQRNFPELPGAATPCALSAVFHSVIGSLLAGYWRSNKYSKLVAG